MSVIKLPKGEVQKFNVEHIPFYKTIEDDYKKCKTLRIN